MQLGMVWVLGAGRKCKGPDPLLCPLEQQKEAEVSGLTQKVSVLAGRVEELSTPSTMDARAVPALRKQLWDMEASTAEQRKELEQQTAAVDHLEQVPWLGMFIPARVLNLQHPHPSGAVCNRRAIPCGSYSNTSAWSWR